MRPSFLEHRTELLQIGEPRKVLVEFSEADLNEELLDLYFSNKKRSGGEDIKAIEINRERTQAVITFPDAESMSAWNSMVSINLGVSKNWKSVFVSVEFTMVWPRKKISQRIFKTSYYAQIDRFLFMYIPINNQSNERKLVSCVIGTIRQFSYEKFDQVMKMLWYNLSRYKYIIEQFTNVWKYYGRIYQGMKKL